MKALSIKQPWAWLIVNGFKDVENRTWPTKYRGPVLIHAGKQVDKEMCRFMDKQAFGRDYLEIERMAHEWPGSKALPTGGIVGRTTLVQCLKKDNMEADLQAMATAPVPYVEFHHSPWFDGKYGFVLKDSAPLEFWQCAGKLGIFDIPFNGGHDLPTQLREIINNMEGSTYDRPSA